MEDHWSYSRGAAEKVNISAAELQMHFNLLKPCVMQMGVSSSMHVERFMVFVQIIFN